MTTSVTKVTFKALLTRPLCLLAYGFGSGLSPVAPGTMGTLAAIPIYWLMQPLSLSWYLFGVIVAFFAGIVICQRAADWVGLDDPGAIVWDEIVGFLITMIAAPTGLGWIVLGFVLFRLFDIAKPWPVSFADRKLHGGLGIMVDDVLAGIYALLVMQAIAYFI